MKYHEIPKIKKSICTAEQKAAYDLAFDAHIHFQEYYDKAKDFPPFLKDDVINSIFKYEIRIELQFLRHKFDVPLDVDAVYSALLYGIEKYLNSPFVASSYEQIGNIFPAYHL